MAELIAARLSAAPSQDATRSPFRELETVRHAAGDGVPWSRTWAPKSQAWLPLTDD